MLEWVRDPENQQESPFLSELSQQWRNSFEGCLDAGVFKGWIVRNVRGLGEHARSYGYRVPPNVWGAGEELVFELHRCAAAKPGKKGEPVKVGFLFFYFFGVFFLKAEEAHTHCFHRSASSVEFRRHYRDDARLIHSNIVNPVHYFEGPSGPPATAESKASRGTKVSGGKGSAFVGFLVKVTALTCAGVIGHLHGAAVVELVEEKLGRVSGGKGTFRSEVRR